MSLKLVAVLGLLTLIGLWLRSRRPKKFKVKSNHRGTASIGAGILELQSFFEPEKKVEILLEKEEPTDYQESGDGPEAGGRPDRKKRSD